MAAKSTSVKSTNLSALPSVDEILRSETAVRLVETIGKTRLTEMSRQVIDNLRVEMKNGTGPSAQTKPQLLAEAEARLEARWHRSQRGGSRRVINATGVVIHTNLGRAPLSAAARAALEGAAGYCSVEFDLETGERGGRGQDVEKMICEISGAEDAIVVNNCAAGAYLVLSTFAAGKEVIISRGELVEIGGEFRVPDVLSRSGATLKEVGTTNRTRLSDYEKAISEKTAVILKVHPSNYRIIGFTASPPLADLVELARRRNVVLYEDAGSGAVADLSQIGLGDEPVIGESILAGADVVTFSGDKLLGGPQAGIIAGKREPIETLRKDPLYRALRVSKLIYAALGATLEAHLAGRGIDEIPVMRMLATDMGSLEQRCKAMIGKIENSSLRAQLTAGQSAVGGGAAPAVHPDSPLIALEHLQFSANELLSRLRSAGVPVIARIVNEKVVLDLRTVGDEEAEEIVAVLNAV